MKHRDPDYTLLDEQREAHRLIRRIFKYGKLETYAGICLAFPKGIEKNEDVWIAISNEGVGTKILVAQLAKKFDTIGIDVVAMNVNDVICLGAKPFAFTDYIALSEGFPKQYLSDILKGISHGANIADVEIVSGETAYITEMLRGISLTYNKYELAFDLSGASIGILKKPIIGEEINERDVIVGLESNGLHSNGFTLARKALLEFFREKDMSCAGYKIDDLFKPTGKSIGEELLLPTKIYVKEIVTAVDSLNIHGLAHITGRGLEKLNRLSKASRKGLVIDNLPDPPAIMKEIQKVRKKTQPEMYKIFNMGIGFCVVLPKNEADEMISISHRQGTQARIIGYVTSKFQNKVQVKLKNQHFIIE